MFSSGERTTSSSRATRVIPWRVSDTSMSAAGAVVPPLSATASSMRIPFSANGTRPGRAMSPATVTKFDWFTLTVARTCGWNVTLLNAATISRCSALVVSPAARN